jgi:hypothetical protein
MRVTERNIPPSWVSTDRRRAEKCEPATRRNAPDRERETECGDASACLKLRIPLIRRDQSDIKLRTAATG